MQAYFFPYIGYFQLINSVDRFLLYENVAFRPGTWMTRNHILPRNGRLTPIFIPAVHGGPDRAIREVGIAPLKNWRTRLLDEVRHAYGRAAFFEETFELLNGIFAEDLGTVHDLNSAAVTAVCRHLGIRTEIRSDNAACLDLEKGLTSGPERKTARIVAICRKEGASVYCNPIGGQVLYRREDFAREGITLLFLRTKGVAYRQFVTGFTPDLSIIDVLMHCGKQGTAELLERCETL